MKTKDKLILIFILFFGFIVFNNNNCLGYTITKDNIQVSTYNGVKYTMNFDINIPDEYLENYTYVFCDIHSFNTSGMKNKGEIVLIFSNNALSYNKTSNTFSGQFYILNKYFSLSDSTYSYAFPNLSTINVEQYYKTSHSIGTYSNYMHLILSTFDIYSNDGNLIFSKTMEPIHGAEPEVDKLNLFELNLTDLDYNNQIHKFNLSTYTNSECYDEIMGCYNNNYQYSIYTTKYQRILTYDDENNMNLQYGSYMLSGYIDFLVTDEAYFYFSPYYNKVLSNSGTKIFNKEVSDYIKRFYYKLVYSEDSDGYGFEIWQDNGSLILGDIYSTPDSCVFIGSSQTIYYANENSKHKIKDLSINRYYTGYNSLSEDNPRSVSYVYNFGFSGGTTTKLFLNSSTYNDDLDKVNYLLDVSYSDRDSFSVQDYNDDNNSVTGLDYSTTTFDREDNVTDETFNEQDDSYFGEERSFIFNDEEDTTNWTLLDYIQNIFKKIIEIPKSILDGFVGLFIPNEEHWTEIEEKNLSLSTLIQEKFSFIDDFNDFLNRGTIDTNMAFSEDNPDILSIEIPSFSYYGGTTEDVTIFNVRDAYEPYRVKIRSLLALIVYGCAFVFLIKNILNYYSTAEGMSQIRDIGGKK